VDRAEQTSWRDGAKSDDHAKSALEFPLWEGFTLLSQGDRDVTTKRCRGLAGCQLFMVNNISSAVEMTILYGVDMVDMVHCHM
jgi:hypothetical protein